MPSLLHPAKRKGKSKRVFQLWSRGFAASPDPSTPAELPEMASLFHTCSPAEKTLIYWQPQVWKHCAKVRACPAPANPPSPTTQLCCWWRPIPTSFLGYFQVLILRCLGCCQPHLVCGLLQQGNPTAITQPTLGPPWTISSFGKAECALHVVQYPHGECLPHPEGGEKEGEVPSAFSAALPDTRCQRQRNLSWSMKVFCMLPMGLCRATRQAVQAGLHWWLMASAITLPSAFSISAHGHNFRIGKKWNNDVHNVAYCCLPGQPVLPHSHPSPS